MHSTFSFSRSISRQTMNCSHCSSGSLPELEPELCNDDMFVDMMNQLDDSREIVKDGLDQRPTQSESESKLKRNFPSGPSNSSERKRLIDRAYRKRRKELLERTKEGVDYLRNETNRLTKENQVLKIEVLDKNKSLQFKEEMTKQLQRNFDQVKSQNQSQSILVRVVSEQLYSASDVDLKRENAELKRQIDYLLNLIDNPNTVEIFKLEQEKAEAERQKKVLNVIVEVLCEKIYNEKHHEQQHYVCTTK